MYEADPHDLVATQDMLDLVMGGEVNKQTLRVTIFDGDQRAVF